MKRFLLILFITIILCFVCFFTYNLVTKEKRVKENEPKQEENLKDVDTVLNDFIEKKQIRRLLSIKKYPSNFMFSNAMFDDDMLLWALDKSCLALLECESVDTKALDYEFENTFNLTNVSYKDYNCPLDNELIYKYDSENKLFKLANQKDEASFHSHTKTYNYMEPIYVKIDGVKKVGKEYVLSLYELYYDLKDNKYISADPKGEVMIFEPSSYLNEKSELDSKKVILDYEKDFEKNKKDYPLFKYTFRKTNNNFYLYKFEY